MGTFPLCKGGTELELILRAERSRLLSVQGGLLAAHAPNSVRSKTSLPCSTAWEELRGPCRQRAAAMAPKQLWLGKNLWHVSCVLHKP